jgi:predicted RNA-binding protein Jag
MLWKNKQDQQAFNQINKRKKRIQIYQIKDKKRNITIDSNAIQTIIQEYLKTLYYC